MKVATFTIGGERRIGVVDEARQIVSPFDFPRRGASTGVLALIGLPRLPRLLNPIPLREITLEAPDPQYFLCRHELSRACRGVRIERLRLERR